MFALTLSDRVPVPLHYSMLACPRLIRLGTRLSFVQSPFALLFVYLIVVYPSTCRLTSLPSFFLCSHTSSSFLPFYDATLLPNLFSLKQGKVVIVLAGRYAGKKAIVVAAKAATKKRPYAHALIAGLIRSPRAVSKTMSKTTIMRKSSIKVFVKNINAAHIMPTRYSATDIKLNDIVVPQKVENAGAGRDKIVARVRRTFSAKYIARGAKHSTGVQYFFQKLRF